MATLVKRAAEALTELKRHKPPLRTGNFSFVPDVSALYLHFLPLDFRSCWVQGRQARLPGLVSCRHPCQHDNTLQGRAGGVQRIPPRFGLSARVNSTQN